MKKNKFVSMVVMSSLALGTFTLPMAAYAATPSVSTYDAASKTTTLKMKDKPKVDIDGTVLIKAMHNAPEAGKAVGDIPLEGFKFRVSWYKGYHNTAEAAKASGQASMTAVWQTNNKGMFNVTKDNPVEGTWTKEGSSNALPLGTLVIEEIESVPGVNISTVKALSHIKLDGQGNAFVENKSGYSTKQNAATIPASFAGATVSPFDQVEEWKGKVSVVKLDKRFGESRNQGDSELAGTQFKVINNSVASVWIDGQEKRPGDTVVTFSTEFNETANKFIAESPNVLPYGSYILKEHAPNDGYLLNKDWSFNFSIRANQQHVEVSPDELPKNDVPKAKVYQGKMDSELNQYLHNGGSSELTRTIFNVYNISRNPIMYQGKEIPVGGLVETISTKLNHPNPGEISAETTEVLPYGTYKLTEKTPPRGYEAQPDWSTTFEIREDGKTLYFTGSDSALQNQVKRFNLEFQKIREEDNTPMANIAFKITDTVTGESHVVVTDENGRFDTELLDPLTNTNANDPTAPNTNGAVQVVDGEWKVVDETKLNNEAGLWFTGTDPAVTNWTSATEYAVNGITADPIDGNKGPLQFATYTLEELRQPANEGRILYKGVFRLDKNGMKTGYKLDLNNLENRAVAVYTDATTVQGGNDWNIVPAKPNQTIYDAVILDNFVTGKAYKLKSELALLNKEGVLQRIIATSEKTYVNKFQTTGAEKAVQTVFEGIDLTGLEGHKLVAMQTVTDETGAVIYEHKELDNEAQWISIPEIGTSAMGDIDREVNGAQEIIRIPDTIKYKNLEAGKTYTAKGTLMNKKTGKPALDAEGNEITAETTFVAEGDMLVDSKEQSDGYVLVSGGGKAVSGEVVVTFEFKAPKELLGETLVAFEKVESDGVEWGVHADINDEDQTVTIPKVETKASDPVDGDQEVAADENVVVQDTVKLINLVVGKTYKVTGQVHLRSEDGKDAGTLGEPVVKEVTATDKNMEVVIETTVNTKDLAGRDIVWFEKLEREGVLLGIHADITDENQTIHIPKIGTKLATIDGAKEVQVGHTWEIDKDGKTVKVTKVSETELQLVDTVEYENVTPGTKYIVKGDIHRKTVEMNEETGEKVCKVKGINASNSGVEFTPTEKKGTVDVPFTVNIADESDLTLVAFEKLIKKSTGENNANNGDNGSTNGEPGKGMDKDGQIVATHEEPCDEDQTITFVDIKTTLKGKTNNDKQVVKSEKETLIDTVRYNNLIPGKSYEMCGTLMDKGTNKPLLREDKTEFKNCTTFVPETPTGSIDIPFEIDPRIYQGKTIVAFENLKREGRLIAIHHDINDEEQTVYVAKIGTMLKDKQGNKVIELTKLSNPEKYPLVDTIKYENLIAGQKYTAKGCLMDMSTKKVKEGTKCETVEFTPESPNGSVDVNFTIDATKFTHGTKVVAFEDVFDKNNKIVGDHKDFEDKNQTVEFTKTPRPVRLAETGAPIIVTALVGALILAAGVGSVMAGRRKEEQ